MRDIWNTYRMGGGRHRTPGDTRTPQGCMEDTEGHVFHLGAVQQEGHSPAQSCSRGLGAPNEQVHQCHVQPRGAQGAPPCPRITPQQCPQNCVRGRGEARLAKG